MHVDLTDLIASFDGAIPAHVLENLQSYVDQGEHDLALEDLATAVYEHHVAVDDAREARFVALARAMDMDPAELGFVGRTPPYPDLRTPAQRALQQGDDTPSPERVRALAEAGLRINAVRMQRALTGQSLADAKRIVDAMVPAGIDPAAQGQRGVVSIGVHLALVTVAGIVGLLGGAGAGILLFERLGDAVPPALAEGAGALVAFVFVPALVGHAALRATARAIPARCPRCGGPAIHQPSRQQKAVFWGSTTTPVAYACRACGHVHQTNVRESNSDHDVS